MLYYGLAALISSVLFCCFFYQIQSYITWFAFSFFLLFLMGFYLLGCIITGAALLYKKIRQHSFDKKIALSLLIFLLCVYLPVSPLPDQCLKIRFLFLEDQYRQAVELAEENTLPWVGKGYSIAVLPEEYSGLAKSGELRKISNIYGEYLYSFEIASSLDSYNSYIYADREELIGELLAHPLVSVKEKKLAPNWYLFSYYSP